MGTFLGHALPGIFYIGFSIWWTVQAFVRYFASRRGHVRYKSASMYPCQCLCGRYKEWPLEGLLKIFFSSFGICMEIFTGFKNHKFVYYGNAQHATMFFFYGMTGVVDILLYLKLPLPKDLDYVVWLLAIFVEGLLFKNHVHGMDAMETLVHTLLIYSIAIMAVGFVLEMIWRENVLMSIFKSYFALVQGTWFWQVGFILYAPVSGGLAWSPDDENSLLLVTMVYTWHHAVDLFIILIIGFIVYMCQRRSHSQNNNINKCDYTGVSVTESDELQYLPLMDENDNTEENTSSYVTTSY